MSIFEAYERLAGRIAGSVVAEERMARHTSLRVGGPASLLVTCDTLDALRAANDVLYAQGIPWVVMGRGTGVLVSDAGYRGAVIVLGREFRHLEAAADGRIRAGAGVLLQRVCQEAFTRELGGLEFAAGIPGTVGGAVALNAQTEGAWLGQLVEEVVTLVPGQGVRRYAPDELLWYHRACSVPAHEIVLEATLRLTPSTLAAVKDATDRAQAWRRSSQPLGKLTCGALFCDERGEDGAEVARLIAGCGLAGRTEGAAQLSARNPNFVVNLGRATADDVTRLIVTTLTEVRQRYGIELRPQVKFLGFPS